MSRSEAPIRVLILVQERARRAIWLNSLGRPAAAARAGKTTVTRMLGRKIGTVTIR